MTAIARRDERGRWTVKFVSGAFIGSYTALDEADARDFAGSPARQQEHRAHAVRMFRERIK